MKRENRTGLIVGSPDKRTPKWGPGILTFVSIFRGGGKGRNGEKRPMGKGMGGNGDG